MTLLGVERVGRVFGRGSTRVVALDDVSLRVDAGEFVAVMGPSGSGKSTLLNLAGGLDQPTSGRVMLAGSDLAMLGSVQVALMRRRSVGFVFQTANLLPSLTAAENVALPQADNRSANNTLLTVIEVLSLLVVAITLIGLVSALTMGVIERTREIGIMRCLGATGRDIRRAFGAEGIALAILGWTLAIPVGWLIFRGLLDFIGHEFDIDIAPVFPVIGVPLALIVVITVTLVVIRPPLRRATRIQPGTALRYQ